MPNCIQGTIYVASIAMTDTLDEVVVTGHRDTSGGSWQFATDNRTSTNLALAGGIGPVAGGGAGAGGPQGISITVNVEVTDAAQKAGALATAQHFAEVLVQLEDKLGTMDPTTGIRLPDGHLISAGDLLNEIGNTQFILNDQSATGANGGVGSAVYSATGPNTDTIYWGALATQNPQPGASSYGDPAYHDQGLVEVLLHELVHMTAFGNADQGMEHQYYDKENNGSDVGFVNSAYWHNGEAFANIGASSIAAAIGEDISLFHPHDTSWTNPFSLYVQRNPGGQIGPLSLHTHEFV